MKHWRIGCAAAVACAALWLAVWVSNAPAQSPAAPAPAAEVKVNDATLIAGDKPSPLSLSKDFFGKGLDGQFVWNNNGCATRAQTCRRAIITWPFSVPTATFTASRTSSRPAAPRT